MTERERVVYYLGTAIGSLHNPRNNPTEQLAEALFWTARAAMKMAELDPDREALDMLIDVLEKEKARRATANPA